ncbi:uncharacterized protein LOC126354807 isoform X2 [Schistocerca gregaria]|uniref:uncharacterized protein LOC126354807 isoform X2 n=2 Tax=Schistocerca gregaria TaxID=7010 RepID=UPI00211F17DB|nr:uncharacterized protein LOC126354807 isoform X2 [Schistocerca gregaria]
MQLALWTLYEGMNSPRTTTSSACECNVRKIQSIPPIVLADVSGGFHPQPYTFRLQQPGRGPRVRAPPFHVLLDHTIAVLWNLFRQRASLQDVGHLQWAKYFLQRIRNHHGEMPPDVQLCVQAIEGRMLSQYADLSKQGTYKPPSCCRIDGDKECQAKQSITFSEMIKQQPDAVQQLFCADPAITTASCSSNLVCDCATSKEEMIKYLRQQRAERFHKLQAELRRLHEIEAYMINIGDNDFKPYVSEDTALKLEELKQLKEAEDR